ncbi:MAG: class B sortase [Bacilli bacterium]
MKKKNIYYILIVFFVFMLIYSIFSIYASYLESESIKKDSDIGFVSLEEDNNSYKREISSLQSKYNNKDIIGIIEIPGTSIKHAFVRGNDNTYYLDHNLYKNKSRAGSIFMDYRNDFDDRQINIYGHNSRTYDVPFKDLNNYLDKDYIPSRNLIYITNKDDVIKYKIQFVNVISSDEHINISFNDPVSFNKHINILRDGALYDKGNSISFDDNILILQTCYLDSYGSYILIVSTKL